MFKEEAGTARVYLALSNDTTCTNGLYSPTNGINSHSFTLATPSHTPVVHPIPYLTLSPPADTRPTF
ncbi:hypothetical protein E2C01_081003 [Portunus trituberculatus]|uniref:Uncharacterized protein n=1 Tax=Portunus trituberculatus TaxID=210409 RepID=A0A5B7IXJ1_PORTR|nr:hypothetical protein [Portunus trituberculatus]